MSDPNSGSMRTANPNTTRLHGSISIRDAADASYFAYYGGAANADPTVRASGAQNAAVSGRAVNTYNLTDDMQRSFGQTNSPFVVIDDSRRWLRREGADTQQEQIRAIGNGYFVTLYHKESGKLIIASPGMEADGIGSDTIRGEFGGAAGRALGDIGDIAGGQPGYTHLRQTTAIHNYLHQLHNDIRAGNITVNDGNRNITLSLRPGEDMRDKVILVGHSSGAIPMSTLAGMGYEAVLFEPRASNFQLRAEQVNTLRAIGHPTTLDAFNAQQADTVNIRASSANPWNSNIVGLNEFNGSHTGRNFVYDFQEDPSMGDHKIERVQAALRREHGSSEFRNGITFVENALPGRAAREFADEHPSTTARAASPQVAMTIQP